MRKLTYDYGNLLRSDKMMKGVTDDDVIDLSQEAAEAHLLIQKEREAGILGFYDLPDQDVSKIIMTAKDLREKFDNFVVLGIGGSALGNKALYSALKNSRDLDREVIVLDNVDPHLLHQTLNSIELEKTVFNVITKSGTTAETIAVFLIVFDILKNLYPEDYQERIIITTDGKKGFLRELIEKEGYLGFDIPDNVGGRFSVLSNVGLLSSAFAGINIEKLLAGAKSMKERCEVANISNNPAYLNGLMHYIYYKKKCNISVMMPYANDLADLTDWYKQLWAESLGKEYDLDDRKINTGQTPVRAIGTTDQHSQLQLYVEGPADKILTFLEVEKFNYDYDIPKLFPDETDLAYLTGKKLSSLLNTEKVATELALYEVGRPSCTIRFPELEEYYLGEFIFMYQVQTVFSGYLMNVNPLDQPGVEAGKQKTMALMGKEGMEELKKQIEFELEDKMRQGAKI